MPQSITPEKDPEEFNKRKKAYEKELESESANK
jgi:hypothetical protein